MSKRWFIFTFSLLILIGPLGAAEYFVSKKGDDGNDGKSETKAFATIRRGVKALRAGDVLTISPGEYFESVRRDNLGTAEKETLIQAKIPGTVLLRGDVNAPKFAKVAGYRFVYAARFDKTPYAVSEIDTLKIFAKCLSVEAVDLSPGMFHYDSETKRLYISTSDMRSPDFHRQTISLIAKSGIHLVNPTRVVIKGIATTGFHNNDSGWSKYYKWGIRLDNPVDCVIRDCRAYLNSGGIALWGGGKGNLIDGCVAYGNNSEYQSEGGNIVRYGGNNDVIRNCLSFRTKVKGISFYGKGRGPVLLENNISWGNGLIDFRIKGHGEIGSAVARNCVALGDGMVYNIQDCLVGRNGYIRNRPMPSGNVRFATFAQTKYREFADPDNLDFRLQSTSQLRGAGKNGKDIGPYPYKPNIFYVKTDGDDTRDGTSIRLAWKTLNRAFNSLKSGDTLYMEPGVYHGATITNAKNVTIRGRGVEPVVIQNKMKIEDCESITVERLRFQGPTRVIRGNRVAFENCVFAAFDAEQANGLKTTHCVFRNEPVFKKCAELFMASDIFSAGRRIENSQISFSDYNAYPDPKTLSESKDNHSIVLKPRFIEKNGCTKLANLVEFAGRGVWGTAVGLHNFFRPARITLAGPFVHSVSDTTINFEWMLSMPAMCEVAWWNNPEQKKIKRIASGKFGAYSLTGLRPGTKYFFTIRSVDPEKNNFNINILGLKPQNATISAKTAKTARPTKTYHVSPNGDDDNDGLSPERPLRAIQTAANKVNAGDKVLIAGGVYKEAVVIRATGDVGKEITFESKPGEKVIISGAERLFPNAFKLLGKNHLRFDGFRFKGQGQGAENGVFYARYSDDLRISRCFFTGRGKGYTCIGLINGYKCSDIVIDNCVSLFYWEAFHLNACRNVVIKNNVSFYNMITIASIGLGAGEKARFSKNILVDSQPFKIKQPLIGISQNGRFIDDDNCYYLRLPDNERKLFLFSGWDKKRGSIGRQSLAEFQKRSPGNTSFIANPWFKATVGMKDDRKMGKYAPRIVTDNIVSKKGLDFEDLFATNPILIERGIGLRPEAFKWETKPH